MSGKKYKPALYELISKEQNHPGKGKTLETPSWFYTGQETKKVNNETKAKESAKPAPSSKLIKELLNGPTVSAHLNNKQLEISASFWILGLVILGLILTHMVSYMLGQRNTVYEQPQVAITEDQQQPADPLSLVRQSPVRQNIYPEKSSQATSRPPVAVTTPIVKQEPVKPVAVTIPVTSAPEVANKTPEPKPVLNTEGSLCYIMCGYESQRELRPVQEYFNKSGLDTEIGRFQGRYVLYTRLTFERKKSIEAARLKDIIVKVGAKYNKNKPKGALGFGKDTFSGAFPVIKSNIKTLN